MSAYCHICTIDICSIHHKDNINLNITFLRPQKMPQRLSDLITLVSVISLASLVTCRPTEEVKYDLIQGESIPDFAIPDGSLPFQTPESDSEIIFGTAESAVLGNLPSSSPSTLSDFSSFRVAAIDSICPGENRFAFCCGSVSCTFTISCADGESLNCCTVNNGPPETGKYDECSEAYLLPPGFGGFQSKNDVSDNVITDPSVIENVPQRLAVADQDLIWGLGGSQAETNDNSVDVVFGWEKIPQNVPNDFPEFVLPNDSPEAPLPKS